MVDRFPCNGCGLCCENIGHINELTSYDRGDSVCKFLKDKQCSIYNDRPLICQIDGMYEHVFYEHFSKEEYYFENLKACKQMQMERGLSEGEQVDVSKFTREGSPVNEKKR